jgi:hypothetical protein
MSVKFDGVIFSRPGESGLVPYVGALWAAEDEKSIDTCKVWISPSTTSIVAIMKILDYSCIDILALLFKLPQLATSPTPFKNPLNLGIENTTLKDIISDRITSKVGSIPTLKELYENRGVVFVGIGFSLSKQEIEYIHKETYPNMSLLDVICISLSTPGIYKPYRVGEDLWVDGSIVEPFSPHSIEMDCGHILAINTKSNRIIYHNRDPLNQVKDMMRTIFEAQRQMAIPEKLSNNISVISIDCSSSDYSLQLRSGWETYTDLFSNVCIIHEPEVGADLQS